MGCHTWIYKKVSALSEKEKLEMANKYPSFEYGWIKGRTYEQVLSIVKERYKKICLSSESPENYAKKIYQKYQDSVKQFKDDPWKYFVEHSRYPAYFEYQGEAYTNIDFDNPFRVYGYPDEAFTNCNDLIKWLKTYNGEIGYYDENGDFVEGYSNELENYIREYFELHGEDNLLVDFG